MRAIRAIEAVPHPIRANLSPPFFVIEVELGLEAPRYRPTLEAVSAAVRSAAKAALRAADGVMEWPDGDASLGWDDAMDALEADRHHATVRATAVAAGRRWPLVRVVPRRCGETGVRGGPAGGGGARLGAPLLLVVPRARLVEAEHVVRLGHARVSGLRAACARLVRVEQQSLAYGP